MSSFGYARASDAHHNPSVANPAGATARYPAATEAEIKGWLIAHFAGLLSVSAESIDPAQPFAQYGVDSMEAVSLTAEIEQQLGCNLPATLAWDYPSINSLARYLAEQYGTQ